MIVSPLGRGHEFPTLVRARVQRDKYVLAPERVHALALIVDSIKGTAQRLQ